MGTNHYVRSEAAQPKPTCPTCNHTPERPEPLELHISKSYRMFQGYREADGNTTPYGEIVSVQDWSDVLRGERGGPPLRIFSEYGDEWTVDQFLDAVYETDRAERGRQYRWMVDHYPAEQRQQDWLDPEGFSFHGGEFS